MQKLFTHSDWGYVIFVNDEGNQLPYSKDSKYNQEGTTFTLKEEGGRGGTLIISDASLVFDEAGVVAFTDETLLEFLRVNTGK